MLIFLIKSDQALMYSPLLISKPIKEILITKLLAIKIPFKSSQQLTTFNRNTINSINNLMQLSVKNSFKNLQEEIKISWVLKILKIIRGQFKLIIINLKNSLPKLTIKTNLTLTKMLIQDLVSEQLKVTIGKDHLMQAQQGLIYQKYLIRLKTNLEFPF